jgi:CDP-glycerol glycerophosphotransferase (TagB/SpsB family)
LRRKLWDFDLEKKVLTIGRPQADHFAGELPYTPDERTVVLYAPTWEGDREAAAYGSIASHGVALATAVLGSPSHRLIYRPHPRSGVLDPEYGAANQAIISAIARANAEDPRAHHVFDDGPSLGWQLAAADVAITDISAMVYDRLATGKPLLIARPSSPVAEVDETGYLGACEWLLESEAASILDVVDRVQHSDEARTRLEYWVERHFGDTTPGAATARFHAAIEQLIREWEKHEKVHELDVRGSDTDPFSDDEDDESTSTDD